MNIRKSHPSLHQAEVGGQSPGNITLDLSGITSSPGLVSYTETAIAGADDFVDVGVTAKDVFDVIVSNTRDITPDCMSLAFNIRLFIPLTRHQSSRDRLGTWVCTGATIFRGYVLTTSHSATVRITGPFALLSGFLHSPLRNSSSRFSSSEVWFVHPVPITELFHNHPQADPIAPFASAQMTANLLGDNAFLVEQLGFGHTSLAQSSSCTSSIMANYLLNSTVGIAAALHWSYVCSERFFSFRRAAVLSARLTIPTSSLL